MPIIALCKCGRTLNARDEFSGKRASCPTCGGVVQIPKKGPKPVQAVVGSQSVSSAIPPEPIEITEFLDPPAAAIAQDEKESVLHRMFETLLDPRSIQGMLMLGGGVLVLGLIVLLINWLNITAPYVIATSMGVGTLVVLGGGSNSQ